MNVAPLARYVPGRQLQLELNGYCGERLINDDDAVRTSIARRSTFTRLPAFKRPAGSIRLECLALFVIFEAGIVIFPPGPGAASSSRVSNSSELLTLITLLARLTSAILPPVKTFEGEGGGILVLLVRLPPGAGVLAGLGCGGTPVPVGMWPPIVSLTGEEGPNGGALLSGRGLFAPAPANVPVVVSLPPKPV